MSASKALSSSFVAGALASYLVVGAIVVTRVVAFHPYASFGLANSVTLARLVVVSLFAGLAFQLTVDPFYLSVDLAWGFCVLALVERALDGIDGYAARTQGMESPFGARFDMEVDALQILLLSILAFMLGKAGVWVLTGGVLRYAFLGAGVLWPDFNRPLPPSLRRKIVAVVQGVTLAVLLAPVVLPPMSVLVAAAALAFLVYSFAVDTLWVVRSQSKL